MKEQLEEYTKEDFEKGNAVIAKYMNLVLVTPEMRKDPSNWSMSYWQNCIGEGMMTCIPDGSLKYHKSWDALMPVYKKMWELDDHIDEYAHPELYMFYHSIEGGVVSVEREWVWSSVVATLNAWNELQTEKMKARCKESKLRAIEVMYSDGTIIPTNMAGSLTDEQMLDYFKVGKLFNIGNVKDKMVTVLSAKILY